MLEALSIKVLLAHLPLEFMKTVRKSRILPALIFSAMTICLPVSVGAAEVFCEGLPSSPQLLLDAYPGMLKEEAARRNLHPAVQDGAFLVSLIDGFSPASFPAPGEPGSPWPAEGALNETAQQVALHVRTGNLVSAQIVHIMASPEWRAGVLGKNVDRLLRTAYAPYEGMQKVKPEFLPQWAKSLPDEDLRLSLDLAQKQAELLDARERLGDLFSVPAVRWHQQALIYNDAVALEVTRRAICADPELRSKAPEALRVEATRP